MPANLLSLLGAGAAQPSSSGFVPSITSSLAVAITDGSTTTAGASGNKISQINGALGTTYNFAQASSSFQPDAVTDTSFGGKRYLSAGGSAYMDTSEWLSTGNAYTIIMALNVGGAAGDQMPFAHISGLGGYIDLTTWSSNVMYGTNADGADFYSVSGSWTRNTEDVHVYRVNGTSAAFWNKSGARSTADNPTAAKMRLGRLFNRGALDLPFTGKLACLLCYDTNLSDGDITTLITEIKTYFSIV